MFLGLRRRDNLSRFLPRQVVERVLQTGDGTLEPVQREVTILFSDIRDFTALSESLPPRAVLGLLDDYFGHMGQIVMVVAAGSTSQYALNQALATIESCEVVLMMLNKASRTDVGTYGYYADDAAR